MSKSKLWHLICHPSIAIKATPKDPNKILMVLRFSYQQHILTKLNVLSSDLINSLPAPTSKIQDLYTKIVNRIDSFFEILDITDKDVNGAYTLQQRVKKTNHIFELHEKEIDGMLAKFAMRLIAAGIKIEDQEKFQLSVEECFGNHFKSFTLIEKKNICTCLRRICALSVSDIKAVFKCLDKVAKAYLPLYKIVRPLILLLTKKNISKISTFVYHVFG